MTLPRCLPLLALVTLVLLTTASVRSDETPNAEEQKRIDKLIAQLNADDFEARNAAEKELMKIGPPALESLRKAAKSTEPEIARRAADLVSQLEELLKSGKQLTPKKVNLKVKDVSVADAVAELSKLSGYPIQIEGDKTKLSEKKITLETGEVSFWEAFDQLCLKGGLVEKTPENATGTLVVAEGTPKPVPTHYAGALRIRMLPETLKYKDGNVAEFMVELSIEPKFRQSKVLGAVKVDAAADQNGKPIMGLEAPSEKPTVMRAPVGLKLGDGQKIKDVSGTVLFETITADKALIIDDPAKNVGKMVKNDDGVSMRLDAFTKKDNGEVTLRASFIKPAMANPGGGIVINQNSFKEFKPELTDANGLPYQHTGTPGQGLSISGQVVSIQLTMTYKQGQGVGEPAQLALSSEKKAALNVPFTFKDIKLP